MPKTNSKRLASKARKNSRRRKNKEKPGRKGGAGSATPAPRVIANSLFALTLQQKPGLEVVDKIDRLPSRRLYGDDYDLMYNDLLPALQKVIFLATGEKRNYDPLAMGLGIGTSLHSIVTAFKRDYTPKDFEVNVEYSEQEGLYYFNICAYCPFNDYWHAFEIKPVIYHLRRTNRKLHDLFIKFIASFSRRLAINAWYNGACGYADYYCDEKLENWEEYDDISYMSDEENSEKAEEKALDESMEDYIELMESVEDYKAGEARHYQSLIEKSKHLTAEKILMELQKFSKRSSIVKFMIDACEFMKKPGCVEDFDGAIDGGEQDGLEFDQQVSIIWDWDDAFTAEQMECMDATANGYGIIPPQLSYPVTKNVKEFDTNDIKKRIKWPAGLSELHKKYVSIIGKLKPKKNEQQN